MASGDTLGRYAAPFTELPTTNYATPNTRNGHWVQQFDTTTQETIYITDRMPQNYSNATGVTVYIEWSAASATSGTIGWDVSFENAEGLDLDADGFATAQTVTAATVDGTSGKPTTTSVAIGKGANMNSVVAGNQFRIRVRRDVANDTALGDAEIHTIEIRET